VVLQPDVTLAPTASFAETGVGRHELPIQRHLVSRSNPLALVLLRDSFLREALRTVAELLRGETTPKTLPRLVARIKDLIAPHAPSPSMR